MQFLHPGYLFALSAIAVPIIVHLFNFRRYKTIYFSNVRFLREVQEETTSRSKLKHLLVLAARILALIFLVLAFAQPYLPNKKTGAAAGRKYVSVYLDNSFSMQALSGGSSLFEKARQAAKEIAKNYSPDDQFQLLSNDFTGKQQRLVSRQEFLKMADELDISPAVRTFPEISKRQQEALNSEKGGARTAYVLSDFQNYMGDLSVDSDITWNLVPFAADAQENVYIDTCWFSEPVELLNRNVQLIVKLGNSGENRNENNRLTLKLNGQTKSLADFSIPPHSFIYDTLGFVIDKSGWNKAVLSIQDYPISFDDNYFIAFNAVEKINVVAINDGHANQYLAAFFNNQAEFNYTTANAASFDPQALSGNRLVIVDGLKTIPSSVAAALTSYMNDGGTVAVFPAGGCDMESYNRFLNSAQANSISGFSEHAQDLAGINLQQNIFKDVFEKVPQNLNLPQAKKYYTFTQATVSSQENVLTLKDGGSFLSRYPYKAGALYVCAVPLDVNFSDLPVHAIFVPLLYKMALTGIHGGNIGYFIGAQTRIEVEAPKNAGGDKVFKIKGENIEFIPEQFEVGNKVLLGLGNEVNKAGFYTVNYGDMDSLQLLALNFDRRESDLRFFTPGDLKDKYTQKNVNVVNAAHAEVAGIVKELDRGSPLWKICIILALLFLAVEIALLRFWRV